jgi:Zn finger protein HypA/HybF involved in hydrogenase expression
MGKVYSFECNRCNLSLSLLEGVGKHSPSPALNFYCPKCEEISRNIKCDFCERELEVEIKIPEKQIVFFGRKKKKQANQQKIVCPRCKSIQTKLTFRATWD